MANHKGYYEIDGKKYPSVTTILGYKPARELIDWAAKIAAETGDPKAHWARSQEAAGRGQEVHKIIAAINEGREYVTTSETEPYIQAYRSWESKFQPRWVCIEEKVYSTEHGFAGTLDYYGYIAEARTIMDCKTSGTIEHVYSKPYPEHRLQVEAYRRAKEEMTGEVIDCVAILKLCPNGTYGYFVWDRDEDIQEALGAWETFKFVKRCYEWYKEYRRVGTYVRAESE